METRIERIVLETDHYRITGEIRLPSEGYRSRMSEFLNRDADFIAVTDAKIVDRSGEVVSRDFICVGIKHVHTAYPAPS